MAPHYARRRLTLKLNLRNAEEVTNETDRKLQ